MIGRDAHLCRGNLLHSSRSALTFIYAENKSLSTSNGLLEHGGHHAALGEMSVDYE